MPHKKPAFSTENNDTSGPFCHTEELMLQICHQMDRFMVHIYPDEALYRLKVDCPFGSTIDETQYPVDDENHPYGKIQ